MGEGWEQAGASSQGFQGPFAGATVFGPEGTSDTRDVIFERLFQDLGIGRRRTRRGQDIDYPVEVSLEEAFHGTTRLITSPQGRRLEGKISPGVDNGSRAGVAGEGGGGARAGGGPRAGGPGSPPRGGRGAGAPAGQGEVAPPPPPHP